LFDGLPDRRVRRRRERILKLEEVCRGSLPDEVGAGRKCLAKFDCCGADRLERGGIIGIGGLAQPETQHAHEAADVGRA
jgi:hypothetical protein